MRIDYIYLTHMLKYVKSAYCIGVGEVEAPVTGLPGS